MISYLKGKIIYKGKEAIILNTNGIGFKVFLAPKILEKIPNVGEEFEVFCVLYIRKEKLELYGQLNEQGLETFKILDKVSGIGPKIALALSSLGSLEEIKRIIESRDKKFLKETRGIGNKKRQMIILELTGKIREIKTDAPIAQDEAFQSLVNLGFAKQDVKHALSKLSPDIKDPEQRIKQALQLLSKVK